MLAHAPLPIAINRRADGRPLYVNPAWTRLTGYSSEEALASDTVMMAFWPDTATRERSIDKLLRHAPYAEYGSTLRTRRGETRKVEVTIWPVEIDGEDCVFAMTEDVTELEGARLREQTMAERFDRVMALNPDPIIVASLDEGRYLALNEAFTRLFGWTREEALDKTARELDIWVDLADRERIKSALLAGEPVRRFPVRFRRRSGEVAEVLFSAELIDWEGRRAMISSPYDITALNRATAQIRQLNESLEEKVAARTAALEEANRELESFSYSVSHDLRAPLRALSGFAALLARHRAVGSDAEARGYAERISGAATRMGTIVDALLHYSRLSRQAVSLRSFDLDSEVRALAQDLDAGSARPILWSIGPLPQVRGDPTLLRLVIQNLMDNAVKYSRGRSAPHIEIGAEQSAEETIVHVRDNGVGFDMAHAAQLFGVFQRLHTDAEFEGTGIGLANAQRIVQRHGGRIWCHAEPDRGATFCFSLPRHESRQS